MYCYFLFSSYHNTKLNRVTRILTHAPQRHALGGNSKSFCKVNQKFKRFLLLFSKPRHTKRKPSRMAKSCTFRWVSRRANGPFYADRVHYGIYAAKGLHDYFVIWVIRDNATLIRRSNPKNVLTAHNWKKKKTEKVDSLNVPAIKFIE